MPPLLGNFAQWHHSNWITPQESVCSKVLSEYLSNCATTMQTVFDIFQIAGYFLDKLYFLWLLSWKGLISFYLFIYFFSWHFSFHNYWLSFLSVAAYICYFSKLSMLCLFSLESHSIKTRTDIGWNSCFIPSNLTTNFYLHTSADEAFYVLAKDDSTSLTGDRKKRLDRVGTPQVLIVNSLSCQYIWL